MTSKPQSPTHSVFHICHSTNHNMNSITIELLLRSTDSLPPASFSDDVADFDLVGNDAGHGTANENVGPRTDDQYARRRLSYSSTETPEKKSHLITSMAPLDKKIPQVFPASSAHHVTSTAFHLHDSADRHPHAE